MQQASWFEDIVIRCVRYAFAYIPASIGRVFFSKHVALPFFRFRMLRHGYFRSPFHWQEINMVTIHIPELTGIYADHYRILSKVFGSRKESIQILILLYSTPMVTIHVITNSCIPRLMLPGGGFAMGSSYFYLEFLIAWLDLLKAAGYHNPAIFALEYTLVPDSAYPVQTQEIVSAYKNICVNQDPSRIVVSGDSAGATLILSLLLHIAKDNEEERQRAGIAKKFRMSPPGMAVLISPWVTLISEKDRNTSSDYLDIDSLHLYARQYAGTKITVDNPLISPGNCRDTEWWRRAAPEKGFFFCYGAEEVFAPEIRGLAGLLKGSGGMQVESREEKGGIHAWPVAALFLSSKSQSLPGLHTYIAVHGR